MLLGAFNNFPIYLGENFYLRSPAFCHIHVSSHQVDIYRAPMILQLCQICVLIIVGLNM
jgi:hypothetical protein